MADCGPARLSHPPQFCWLYLPPTPHAARCEAETDFISRHAVAERIQSPRLMESYSIVPKAGLPSGRSSFVFFVTLRTRSLECEPIGELSKSEYQGVSGEFLCLDSSSLERSLSTNRNNDYGHPNKPFNFNNAHVPFDGRRSVTVLPGPGVCFAQFL